MLRKALFVSFFTLFASAFAGCHLYINDEYENEPYEYCDNSGCYTCDEWGCRAGNEGSTCKNNNNCEAGCFCNGQGFCEEAGFCSQSSSNDCPSGFECDDRSSCVPEGSNQVCTNNESCPMGSLCDVQTGSCVRTGVCDSSKTGADDSCGIGFICSARNTCVPEPCNQDKDCQAGFYCNEEANECVEATICDALKNCPNGLFCDADRNTCVPEDEVATCQSSVSCSTSAPICPVGSTPSIKNGCYTGQCIAKSECPDGAPFECRDLNNAEAACIANAACGSVYKGVNCTSTDGSECTSGSANCSCESFEFDYCEES